jgi:hypothetical protein
MLSTTKRGSQHKVRPYAVRKFFQTQLEALKEIRRAGGNESIANLNKTSNSNTRSAKKSSITKEFKPKCEAQKLSSKLFLLCGSSQPELTLSFGFGTAAEWLLSRL